MLSVRACQSFLLITALAITPAFASRTHKTSTSTRHHRVHLKRTRHHVNKGQRGIDSDRAREIQSALIQKHYLTGAPSGQWDAQTEAAMQKYQSDHGWQTKLTPDSRALISLGLGPDHPAGTPESAAVAPAPAAPATAPNTLASTHVIQN
jgi:peptidoglycan hydrolase-like protein with peptidoglycan-binding domain